MPNNKTIGLAEKGSHQFEIIGVRATFVRVVEQPNITVLHAPPCGGHACCCAHGKSHGTHKDGQARLALHQGIAADGIVQTVACVMRLSNDGVERTSVKRGVHFIGHLF